MSRTMTGESAYLRGREAFNKRPLNTKTIAVSRSTFASSAARRASLATFWRSGLKASAVFGSAQQFPPDALRVGAQ